MKSYGIIFDCDGTLVDSLNQAVDSMSYALAQVGEHGLSPARIKQYFGAGVDRILGRILGDAGRAGAAFEYYLEHQATLALRTQMHTSVREMLKDLADRGVPMAVVTGRHERDLELVLAPHNLKDYFVTLVADNHAAKSKPAPDGVLLAAKRMGLDPAHTFYVGDAVYDMQAARAAGSVPLAALWNHPADSADLKEAGAALLAHSPLDIWPLFQRHFRLA